MAVIQGQIPESSTVLLVSGTRDLPLRNERNRKVMDTLWELPGDWVASDIGFFQGVFWWRTLRRRRAASMPFAITAVPCVASSTTFVQ